MNEYKHTRVYKAPPRKEVKSVHSIDRMLAHSLLSPKMKWRHHQRFGVLQAYFSEGDEQEVRVHIWHPDLVEPELRNGNIHDHRFDFISTVIYGEMHHTEVDFDLDDQGEYEKYNVLHARLGSNEPTKLPGRYRATFRSGVLRRNEMYSFPKGAFHETRVEDLCVTLLTKSNQVEKPAIIVSKVGRQPRFGVNLDASSLKDVVSKYTQMAFDAIMKSDRDDHERT